MTGFDEPATMQQCGAVAGEFNRLGYSRSAAGRARRLADSAALLGVPPLSSSAELTKGEAGRLLHMLRGCGTPGDLRALLGTASAQDGDSGAPAAPCRPGRWRWGGHNLTFNLYLKVSRGGSLMPPRNRHPFKQQPRDTRAHELLEDMLDHGYLDSGKDYVVQMPSHAAANEGRLSVRRGARHFGVSCAARVIGPDGEQCTYECPDPAAPHALALQLYSKDVARRYVAQRYAIPAALKYNPYRRRST